MPTSPPASEPTQFDRWCQDRLQPIASVSRATRTGAGGDGFDADAFAGADLLSVRFADGSLLHTDPRDFLARHAPTAAPGAATRAGLGTTAGAARIALPFELPLTAAATTRAGAAQTVQVESYTLARLTEPTTLDKLYGYGELFVSGLDRWFGTRDEPAAKPLAAKLCAAYENATLHEGVGSASGVLLRWRGRKGDDKNHDGWWATVDPRRDGAAAGPVLLLLHGTASSTRGSFDKLWLAQPGDAGNGPLDFTSLAAGYAHVLAWEHRSLTRSPLDNVVALLRALTALKLPSSFALDVVSHSRGGLVGELLSLAGLTPDELRRVEDDCFKAAYPDAPDPHPDQPLVAELFAQLGESRGMFDLRTFVRVACPTRGTLLADRRTDLFLSLLLRSIGLAFGTTGVPLYERFNGLVQSLVSARAEARSLPGLEAMIPGAPLTLALNMPTASGRPPVVPGRLRVVAGDTRGLGWAGLTTLLGDVFYGLHDHDFVVHTHSMFGGFARDDAKSLRIEDKSVNHFAYFRRDSKSRRPLLAALAGRDEGWQPLADDERRTRNWVQTLKRAPLSHRLLDEQWLEDLGADRSRGKPVLVVLPGIMGSELSLPGDDGTLVWLSLAVLARGGLGRLELRPETDPLRPSGLVPTAYERLLEAARAAGFDVAAFAYDWRASIRDSGEALAQRLERLVEATQPSGVPIHLLAHSMGGLVAREALFGPSPGNDDAATARRAGLRQALEQRGGRLLMLGTPNAGSYAPVRLLLQQHNLSNLVALLARKVSAVQLAQWSGRFAGLMEMLPQDADGGDPLFGSLFTPAAWTALRAAEPRTQPPPGDVLDRARETSRWLAGDAFKALKKNPNVLYVAGQAPTPVALRRLSAGPASPRANETGAAEPAAGGVGFEYAVRGDGTVGWDSALDPERTWYAPCEHGDLPDCVEAFEAYFELLRQGRTLRLPQRPSKRGADAARGLPGERQDAALPAFAQATTQLPSLPDDVVGYVLGMRHTATPPAGPPPIEVRVVHGSLDYARYPLLVGHYLNDYLTGAAKRVDEKLGGQLQRLVDLKLFDGAPYTGVYLRPATGGTDAPPYGGALVLGLGRVGELNPGRLADTVTRGVLRFAFEHVHRDPFVDRHDPVLLRLSTLLVGTHVQAVTPRDSLAGVLQGVWHAAQLLARDTSIGRPVQLVELEIVEIEESVALDAAYELRRLLDRPEWNERLYWRRPVLESRDGGLRGYRPHNIGAVWQRLVVEKDAAVGGLRYSLIAERARVESTRVFADVDSLHDYISRLSDEGALGGADAEASALGRVLFQLLLPQDLKGRLANFDNTVLVLDDDAARQPWELLMPPGQDGDGGEEARPLAVQAGMVRQRIAADYRRLPAAIQGWNALVVGAPDTGGWRDAQGRDVAFAPLPGARDEALAVARALREDHRNWTPTLLIGDAAPARSEGSPSLSSEGPPSLSSERVRTALYIRPYRLLHLAGHGIVNWDGGVKGAPLRTGMVLSHQQVLGAADIEQIDPPPEFVFINCCYSGRDPNRAAGNDARSQRNFPVLAASLALQFVHMGSKAVVAAGWQVGDAAGQTFARALYREVLLGRRFGKAVQTAREETWRSSARAGNTWGAYQCYGNPEWRLESAAGAWAAETEGAPRLRHAERCMSHYELAQRIQQVVAVAGDTPSAPVLRQLDALEQALREDPDRRDWLDSSLVRAAFGEAYRELNDHDQAVRWFQRGARVAYSKLQLRQLELMINSLSRLGGKDAKAHDVAQAALDRLGGIDDEKTHWPRPDGRDADADDAVWQDNASSARSERLCLLASDLMRSAADETRRRRRVGLLRKASSSFAAGYEEKLKSPRDHVDRRIYALSNAMLCTALAVLSAGGTRMPAKVQAAWSGPPLGAGWQRASLDLLEETARGGLATKFWHYTNTMELLTSRTLLALLAAEDGQLDQLGKEVRKDLAEAFALLCKALERWPSPSERESLQHRYRLMRDVLAPLLDHGASTLPPRRNMLERFDDFAAQALERLDHRPDGSPV